MSSIFGLLSAIGPAFTLATELPSLINDLEGLGKDPALKSALSKCPHLSADIVNVSTLLRTVQNSAAAVGKDKNVMSKVNEIGRLIGHVKALQAAIKSDSADPAVLAEVNANPVLSDRLSAIMSKWQDIQGALQAIVSL